MADIPQSSKFDWTVSFAPRRNLISVPLSSRKDTDTNSSEANCNDFDSTKLQRYHVHMKVGRAQSEPSNTSGAGASPPPVPPRLGKPFHRSPRPASQYLQPVSAMTSELQSPRRREAMRSTDLQTARKRREAVNKVKRQRHMSVPIFEEWNLRKESKPSADEATVLTSTSKVDSQTFSDGSVAIKLSQFILQYAHMLPLRVKIVQGYGSTLCTGRIYNIHFIKQLKVQHTCIYVYIYIYIYVIAIDHFQGLYAIYKHDFRGRMLIYCIQSEGLVNNYFIACCFHGYNNCFQPSRTV